jgi:uncharacterized surface protein with fasciclin (FAS1) repeats
MSPIRLLTAVSAAALLAAPVLAHAQAAAPKTEAAAKAQTGKASTDAPAASARQGAAAAVSQAAPSAAAAAKPAGAQAPAAPAAGLAKPVVVNGDLMDTLKLNGQFTTFVKAVDSTNLTGLLKTNKNLTVFAPTDAAFAAMPAGELDKLMADKPGLQKFVLMHIVNAPIPASKIKGAKGPVPSAAGQQIMLDGSDEAGVLKVGGANILQSDVQTASGLLQVVDHVMTPADAMAAAPPAPAAPGA